jgi:hypothetical protein
MILALDDKEKGLVGLLDMVPSKENNGNRLFLFYFLANIFGMLTGVNLGLKMLLLETASSTTK